MNTAYSIAADMAHGNNRSGMVLHGEDVAKTLDFVSKKVIQSGKPNEHNVDSIRQGTPALFSFIGYQLYTIFSERTERNLNRCMDGCNERTNHRRLPLIAFMSYYWFTFDVVPYV